MNEVRPLRLLLKALALFVLANLAFAYFNPQVGKFSIYNWVVPGRQRVPYERETAYYLISHTVPVYEDMDAMYQSHVLSEPKTADEFRVVLIGDSSAWGFGLLPEDTLSGQLNKLDLMTCTGKEIVFYNAAFPLPYLMKDLLILDEVRAYDPDMFLWTITLDAFRNRSVYTRYFLAPYASRVYELIDEYRIVNLETGQISAPAIWEQTIVGQRGILKRMFLLQLHGLGWSATGIDYYYFNSTPLSNDVSDTLLFDTALPGGLDFNAYLFDVLGAGYERVDDIPLLVVNEPIFIASGKNSDIRYNDAYPRWAYDQYLQYLDTWMRTNDHDYLNVWNALPMEGFSDAFHRTPAGEKILAELIVPQLQKLSCIE